MRVLYLALLAACATAPKPEPKGGPRGLRASEHLEAARTHQQLAMEATAPRERRPDVLGQAPETVPVPWTRSWDTSAQHEAIAKDHLAAAAQQHAELEAACGSRSIDQVALSPITRYGVGGWETSTGVIVYLRPEAGMPDQLLADIRCHRAWMMMAPSGMDDCPLDLPGMTIDAHGEEGGITLSIAVKNPALVPELHRRAAHELESAARYRAGQVQ